MPNRSWPRSSDHESLTIVIRGCIWNSTESLPCLFAVLAAATGCVWRTDSRPVCSAPPQRYTLVPLPLLPSAINDHRQITGITDGHRAAIWSEGSGLREIPIPSGFASSAGVGINNKGHVLLMAYDRTFSRHQAFTFSNGRLAQLPGMQTRGFQLNDRDEVVGEAAETGSGKTNPVYWSNGDLHSDRHVLWRVCKRH